MDKHEYMIWRAVTKYDLLHDESSGATEENVEEMIDEKEKQITKLIPNYFVGKEDGGYWDTPVSYLDGVRKLTFTISFIATKDDYIKWRKSETLCVYGQKFWFHLDEWEKYRMINYSDAISFILDFDYSQGYFPHTRYHSPDCNSTESLKEYLNIFKLFTFNQAVNACVAYDCSKQITPNGEEVFVCTFVGEDYLEKRGDKNE